MSFRWFKSENLSTSILPTVCFHTVLYIKTTQWWIQLWCKICDQHYCPNWNLFALTAHIHFLHFLFVCFHQAEPVLSDIQQVCQAEDQQTQQNPADVPTQVRKKNICFGRRHSVGPLLFPWLWVILFLERCRLFCLQNNSSLFLNHSPTSAAEVGKKHFSVNHIRKPQIIFGGKSGLIELFFKVGEISP